MAHGALRVDPGDGTSGGVPKDGDEVRLLIESVSESDRHIVLELWFDYLGQLVVGTGRLTR